MSFLCTSFHGGPSTSTVLVGSNIMFHGAPVVSGHQKGWKNQIVKQYVRRHQ